MYDRMWPAQQQSSLRYEELEQQSSLRYEEIEQASSPARPLDFPSPRVHRCAYFPVSAIDHRSGRVHHIKHVLARCHDDYRRADEVAGDRAYLVKKKISKSTYGSVRVCVVLKRRSETKGSLGSPPLWESTDEMIVIKGSSWDRIRAGRGRNLEDPLKEAAALQFVGNYHSHINGCIEVLQDDENLYTVMPHYPGGDLYSKVLGSRRQNHETEHHQPDEMQARIWFRQLLDCLAHLEKKGMCHRDISLENIVLDAHDNLVLIDFGLALRVPYIDCTNDGGVADVSEGSCRRLIIRQGQAGNLTFLAPEVVDPENEFDGFAVDLWSAGVILFILLVGMAPFEWAHMTDYRFRQINKGKLRFLLNTMDLHVSSEACNLLQNMLWRDPRKRLTLSEVLSHPWVVGSHPPQGSFAPDEEEEVGTPRSYFSPKTALAVPAKS